MSYLDPSSYCNDRYGSYLSASQGSFDPSFFMYTLRGSNYMQYLQEQQHLSLASYLPTLIPQLIPMIFFIAGVLFKVFKAVVKWAYSRKKFCYKRLQDSTEKQVTEETADSRLTYSLLFLFAIIGVISPTPYFSIHAAQESSVSYCTYFRYNKNLLVSQSSGSYNWAGFGVLNFTFNFLKNYVNSETNNFDSQTGVLQTSYTTLQTARTQVAADLATIYTKFQGSTITIPTSTGTTTGYTPSFFTNLGPVSNTAKSLGAINRAYSTSYQNVVFYNDLLVSLYNTIKNENANFRDKFALLQANFSTLLTDYETYNGNFAHVKLLADPVKYASSGFWLCAIMCFIILGLLLAGFVLASIQRFKCCERSCRKRRQTFYSALYTLNIVLLTAFSFNAGLVYILAIVSAESCQMIQTNLNDPSTLNKTFYSFGTMSWDLMSLISTCLQGGDLAEFYGIKTQTLNYMNWSTISTALVLTSVEARTRMQILIDEATNYQNTDKLVDQDDSTRSFKISDTVNEFNLLTNSEAGGSIQVNNANCRITSDKWIYGSGSCSDVTTAANSSTYRFMLEKNVCLRFRDFDYSTWFSNRYTTANFLGCYNMTGSGIRNGEITSVIKTYGTNLFQYVNDAKNLFEPVVGNLTSFISSGSSGYDFEQERASIVGKANTVTSQVNTILSYAGTNSQPVLLNLMSCDGILREALQVQYHVCGGVADSAAVLFGLMFGGLVLTYIMSFVNEKIMLEMVAPEE